MNVSIMITFKEEVSTHDGYCSDKECEFSTRTYKKIVQIDSEEVTNNLQYYSKYADPVDVEGDSYFCENSVEASSADVGKHEYRITVLHVALVK
jgi:hypothetical protein